MPSQAEKTKKQQRIRRELENLLDMPIDDETILILKYILAERKRVEKSTQTDSQIKAYKQLGKLLGEPVDQITLLMLKNELDHRKIVGKPKNRKENQVFLYHYFKGLAEKNPRKYLSAEQQSWLDVVEKTYDSAKIYVAEGHEIDPRGST